MNEYDKIQRMESANDPTNTHLDRRAWLRGISTVVTGAAAAAALPKTSGAAQAPEHPASNAKRAAWH